MRKRNIQTNIRMTEKEIERIRKKAKRAKMTFSNYVISSALNNEVIVIDAIKDFTHQLSKVGINLNQITMLCHQGKINCVDIASVNKILKEIWEELICIRK
ncbi:plasmid mobilization protein [Oceanirhabdus seepicola]|uniref:Plasmid mobilization relaxosome protein MobC n=1 Tax=Oceanirhabdus seepicola TaxID=2828781 RepID=A0A9J6P3F5_9CLOT|nr:plasmid mobilization relaxosome protein MobC [Oceanirhabdus seepicola]MCM1991338.1 plasmid mobilization relaxosome protein MobC [Oceanirhabdus seepicola]